MPVSPADFEFYSRVTGQPIPRDPAARMQMAPQVYAMRRGPLSGIKDRLGGAVRGAIIGGALVGGGALVSALADDRRLAEESAGKEQQLAEDLKTNPRRQLPSAAMRADEFLAQRMAKLPEELGGVSVSATPPSQEQIRGDIDLSGATTGELYDQKYVANQTNYNLDGRSNIQANTIAASPQPITQAEELSDSQALEPTGIDTTPEVEETAHTVQQTATRKLNPAAIPLAVMATAVGAGVDFLKGFTRTQMGDLGSSSEAMPSIEAPAKQEAAAEPFVNIEHADPKYGKYYQPQEGTSGIRDRVDQLLFERESAAQREQVKKMEREDMRQEGELIRAGKGVLSELKQEQTAMGAPQPKAAPKKSSTQKVDDFVTKVMPPKATGMEGLIAEAVEHFEGGYPKVKYSPEESEAIESLAVDPAGGINIRYRATPDKEYMYSSPPIAQEAIARGIEAGEFDQPKSRAKYGETPISMGKVRARLQQKGFISPDM
jgi:hypothetical protein